MGVDRRRVLVVSLSLFVSAGCLDDESLTMAFDLRIENRDMRPRELAVIVERVNDSVLYDRTHQLGPDGEIIEPAIVETPGRYRIGVTDLTTDEERTAERHVELSTGAEFCGWFAVRAEPESVVATVPRCPNEGTNETENRETNP